MEICKIENLYEDWQNATWLVIEFKSPGLEQLRDLFKETYAVVEEFCNKDDIPKVLGKLMLEMKDFGWWVCDLDETPLHKYYQEVNNIISALKRRLFTPDYNMDGIENEIDEIIEFEI